MGERSSSGRPGNRYEGMTSGEGMAPRFEVKRRVQHSSPEVRRPPLSETTETAGRGTMAYTRESGDGRRHPLVATLMALPLAVLLLLVFDGWETVAIQASSVGEMLGR